MEGFGKELCFLEQRRLGCYVDVGVFGGRVDGQHYLCGGFFSFQGGLLELLFWAYVYRSIAVWMQLIRGALLLDGGGEIPVFSS